MKGLRKMIVWKEFSFFDRIFEEIYFIIYYSVWNVNNKCCTNVRRIHWLTNLRCEFQNFARTHSPTRLMSSENTYSLSKEHCNLKYSGECKDCFFQKYFQRHPACSGHCKIFKRQNSMEFFINSFKLYISTCILYLFIKSINYFTTHSNVTAYRTKLILLHDSFLLVWPRTVYIYLSYWLSRLATNPSKLSFYIESFPSCIRTLKPLASREWNPGVTILSWFREARGSEGCIIIEDLELAWRGS